MPTRLAAILALLVFAVCLVIGGLEAGNPFSTTVLRALAGMGVTFIIGLVIGTMGQRMIDENLEDAIKESAGKKENKEELKGKRPSVGR